MIKRNLPYLFAALMAVPLLSSNAAPASAQSFSGEQRGEIERIVKEYLLSHPELLQDVMAELEKRQTLAEAEKHRAAVKEHSATIFSSPRQVTLGNAQGDVTVVEFFDYNCPYCRVMAPVMEQAQAADPKLRIVYKEFPVLGPGSVFAAKAALAANKQGKYTVFHHALYQARGQLDEAKVLEVAAVVGLDIDRLKADMEDPAINGDLDKNTKLGELLHITGTPGFVVGDQVATGATELKNFQALIAKARDGHEPAK